jgi:hypothetical protein
MKTLLLLPGTWDLTVDASGNIAVASDPYSRAQDASSAIRLFLSELWYDTTQGIDYWGSIIGYPPNIPLLKAKLAAQALSVPGIKKATVFISSIVDREVHGQVQVTDVDGNTSIANF